MVGNKVASSAPVVQPIRRKVGPGWCELHKGGLSCSQKPAAINRELEVDAAFGRTLRLCKNGRSRARTQTQQIPPKLRSPQEIIQSAAQRSAEIPPLSRTAPQRTVTQPRTARRVLMRGVGSEERSIQSS